MLTIPFTALSVFAILLAAVAPSAAGGFDRCYYPCTARCAAKYACEQRNAGPNCFTNYNKCRSFCWRVCRQ